MELDEARTRVVASVAATTGRLLDVSHEIFDHPELCFEEHRAHDLLCDELEGAGLRVQRGAHGLPTAFRAEAGTGGPRIAVICEYDALPGIGHACGHNVIAAAGLGAGLAAAAVAEACGGTVVVLGTPAEEGGGGKEYMIREGALDGIDAAMMVHPAHVDLDSFWAIAIQELNVEFRGHASHAAAAPHLGRNALDAAVLTYQSVGALRQHLAPYERVHGVFTNGGDKANIVPDRAAMQWFVRSRTLDSLEALKHRVVDCITAGSLAAGCSHEITWADVAYADLRTNVAMSESYRRHAATLGRTVGPRTDAPEFMGSTDMGNVSQLVPSIHPMIAVAPDGIPIHSPEFAGHARGERGDRAVIDAATALALTVVDLWLEPGLLGRAQAEFAAVSARV